MKKTKEQEQIELLEKKIEHLNLKQQAVYEYTRYIADNHVSNTDFYKLEMTFEKLQETVSKLESIKPKYCNPHGWSFFSSFVPAMLFLIFIILIIISDKIL